MQDILSISCGLDVHKETVVACIIKSLPVTVLDVNQQNKTTTEIKIFSTLLDDLNRLKQWIESENCEHVAMESTGVYWCPVYDVLESAHNGDIELLVTNARHMKNVPGKKSDMNDAEWIASLLRAGLLRGSFIPETGIRELRQLTRYRKTIVQDIGRQKNRIEKQLQQCGFKMSTFLTDIFGVSGRNLLNILANTGLITPLQVEKALRARAKLKKDEMKFALNGNMNQHQRDFLRLQLALLDELTKHLSNVENDIQKSSSAYSEQIQLLTTVPGIALTAATAIISEIGTDMSKFPTAEHFSSWAGLSPGENESAGKKKSTRINFGNTYIKSMLCEVAWCMVRSKETYLSNFYWRVKQRRGAKKAIIAVARKILVIIYHMLKNNEAYNEDKFTIAKEKQDKRQLKSFITKAKKLGLQVTIPEQASDVEQPSDIQSA